MKPTPTSHGDWRVINGQLVDVSRNQPPPEGDDAAEGLAPAAEPTESPTPARQASARSGRRHNTKQQSTEE